MTSKGPLGSNASLISRIANLGTEANSCPPPGPQAPGPNEPSSSKALPLIHPLGPYWAAEAGSKPAALQADILGSEGPPPSRTVMLEPPQGQVQGSGAQILIHLSEVYPPLHLPPAKEVPWGPRPQPPPPPPPRPPPALLWALWFSAPEGW